VWVGLEVDGVRHSADGGETWTKVNGQIPNQDVHNVLVVAGPPTSVFTVVNDDVWRSTDDGRTWTPARAREAFPWHYPRGIAVKPDDPRTVYVTLGDSTPGRIGTVMRSRDAGATWQNLALPGQPNSAMWTVSLPAAAPDTVFAASRYGNSLTSRTISHRGISQSSQRKISGACSVPIRDLESLCVLCVSFSVAELQFSI
jgi:photosystem II stability/assembly factor-like uncharacterized protein